MEKALEMFPFPVPDHSAAVAAAAPSWVFPLRIRSKTQHGASSPELRRLRESVAREPRLRLPPGASTAPHGPGKIKLISGGIG